ncbi:hypothetical protein Sango_2687300 [Sesamum angolense]|uniref:Uncharacterized protein n=1 Tax=Sesamum angolense TaxID=2727404 RepID=A0AAE1W2Q1_9LAMI|nr:hypothetical protein Sango_2687300 [Sesamum angolense]
MNHVKYKVARPRLTGEQIRDWVANISLAIEILLTLPSSCGSEHNWTKKGIFWDIPYWATHLTRHNLDIMHIEKIVFDNILNTVMGIKEMTKDNLNARKDLKIICNWPELDLDEQRSNAIPKVVYALIKEQKRTICQWIHRL